MSFWRAVICCGIRFLPLAYMAFIWFLSSQPRHSVIDLGFYDSLIKESCIWWNLPSCTGCWSWPC
ncbi:hypothetical protein P378_01315 [Desulforamulus profundi]|uniref:Uncharacterized protein n=1 Tax=Desulforamulus profundi TaxID=1383067 RepID=A0A2C6L4H5_9FIRM|nr:hypothetical protein [Desulforamulus profundi]PHJ39851.1 hypothetical protein P378_01315 [Desulforamulus profundi]